MMQPSPDPLVQAALDARFRQVPLKLVPPADRKSTAHVAPADPDSKLDFSALNLLSHQIATMLPANEPVPTRIDPQTVMQNPRSIAVVKAKDEGNVCHVAVQDGHCVYSCPCLEIIRRGKICTGDSNVHHGC